MDVGVCCSCCYTVMNLEGSHKPCLSLVLSGSACLHREGKRTLVFLLIRVSGARGDREKTVYLFPCTVGRDGPSFPSL